VSTRRGSGALIEDVLEALDAATAPTFPELLGKLWDLRYQGSVTFHFAGGLPRAVVLQQEAQVPLDTRKELTAPVATSVD
jgi:hypothetical protein